MNYHTVRALLPILARLLAHQRRQARRARLIALASVEYDLAAMRLWGDGDARL